MGRGRQKAKQKKIARKLKYLTTDTDYDELAKELGAQEPGNGSTDPFTEVEKQYSRTHGEPDEETHADNASSVDDHEDLPVADDDLDDYAKWAAEAAAKASSSDNIKSASAKKAPMPKPHKPIHMPVPSALRKPKPKEDKA